jgi:hypothetical protein
MRRIRAPWSAFLGVSLAALTLSCGAGPKPEPGVPEAPPPMPAAEPAPPAPQGPPLLPASVVAQIDDEKTTPYFARRGDDGLLFYSAAGRWLTRTVDADGNPKGPAPVDVGPLAGAESMASLRPVGDGYLAVWSELVAKNHALKILALDAEGKAAGAPILVTQVADDVVWVDVLPNAKGALVLWEVTHDDRSDVTVVPVTGGKVEGSPSLVVQGAIGWEAEATERGAAIATVMSDVPATPGAHGKRKPARTAEEATRGTARLGKVVITEVDTHGKASPPVVVSPEVSAQIDVTLAEVGGKYLLAWTDERNIDAAVFVATVEPGGKVAVPPHRATSPFGEQALVSLVAESYAPTAPRSKRALLAWEDQLKVQRDGRLIHLSTIGADGQLGRERATLVFSASGPPDIEPDGEGFAALTLAPVHDMPPGVDLHTPEGAKPEAPVWPAFVRFGADLTVVASEPVRADAFGAGDKVPYITRALTCRSGKCMTLGIGTSSTPREANAPSTPAPLALVSLPVREGPWKAPAYREADESAPRATSVAALFDGDHLSKVAAADLPGGGALTAWVTYFLQVTGAPAGKKGKAAPADSATASATLAVRSVGANGVPGKPVTIATTALSIGGVALAPAATREGRKPETALAWVASERGEGQVTVTKLGPEGEKLAQKGVTSVSRKRKGGAPSEASDVAIAYAGGEGSGGDGWITAWVDSRDGNAEIYVAKLDRSLNKVVPDRRITEAPGDSLEPQIAVRGKDVFVVWSDAREQPDEGNGDIYLARLDAATLKKSGPETRLFASATHSRTPQIQPWGKGLLVSWIEEGRDAKTPGADADADAGLRVAVLDDKGTLIGSPVLVRAGAGQAVTSAALGCGASECRGVLTAAAGDALMLDAFEITPGSPAGPLKAIAALTGGAGQDASPSFAGPAATSLFFADDAVGGTGRVRWMQIAWP